MKILLDREQTYFWIAVLVWFASGRNYTVLAVALIATYAIWQVKLSERRRLQLCGAGLGLLAGLLWLLVIAIVSRSHTSLLTRPNHLVDIAAGFLAGELRWRAIQAYPVERMLTDLVQFLSLALRKVSRQPILPAEAQPPKQEKSYDAVLADKILIRIIASAQLMMSLAGLLLVPILFNYGGGAANPGAFFGLLFYIFCGLLFAIYLYSRSLPARVLALIWHGVFLGVVFLLSGRVSGNETERSRGFDSVVLQSGLAFIYLASTSIARIYASVKANPAEVANQGSSRSSL
jgi:hypothetical protein